MAEEVRLSFAEHKRTALLQFTNASLRVTVSDFNSDLSLLFLILCLIVHGLRAMLCNIRHN